uniref:hypothetical protein n=1 Tax=Siminovitchia sp. FSL W7-1587 TaxID=2954699 RepID=UPI00403EE445
MRGLPYSVRHGLQRRKAACADNASMENLFGILKQEMYYGEKLVSYEENRRLYLRV